LFYGWPHLSDHFWLHQLLLDDLIAVIVDVAHDGLVQLLDALSHHSIKLRNKGASMISSVQQVVILLCIACKDVIWPVGSMHQSYEMSLGMYPKLCLIEDSPLLLGEQQWKLREHFAKGV
jgi:hypothetical protein